MNPIKIKHPNQQISGIYFHSEIYKVPADIRLEHIKKIQCYKLEVQTQDQLKLALDQIDIESQIEDKNIVFESNSCVSVLHLGAKFHTIYIIEDNQVTSHRKFNVDGQRSHATFSEIIQSLQSFTSIFMASYSEKHQRSFDAIYIYSDNHQIPANITEYTIGGLPIQELAIKTGNRKQVPTNETPNKDHILLTGLICFSKSNNPFNLIPLMKRFEWFSIKLMIGLFIGVILYTLIWTGISKSRLEEKISKLNTVESRLEQAELNKKKQSVIKLRNTAKKYQTLIDIIDKVNSITANNLPVSDFLLRLSNIQVDNITFKNMSIRKDKIILNGTSMSGNSSDNFFKLIQELQTIHYLDNIKYNIKYGAKSGTIDFTINVFWKTTND